MRFQRLRNWYRKTFHRQLYEACNEAAKELLEDPKIKEFFEQENHR